MSDSQTDFLERIRRLLDHSAPLKAPTPPAIPEPIVRLVHSDIGLPELFSRRAANAEMLVDPVHPDDLAGRIVEFLRSKNAKRIGLPVSPLLDRLGITAAIKSAFDAKTWDELTLDQAYDLDASVTDVAYAVAETGSLVIRPSAKHGRALSLIPPLHVAVVEPSDCVADLLDLFDRVQKDGITPNLTLITGPSKTADIEGVLVVGVHGPGTVKVFVLQ